MSEDGWHDNAVPSRNTKAHRAEHVTNEHNMFRRVTHEEEEAVELAKCQSVPSTQKVQNDIAR